MDSPPFGHPLPPGITLVRVLAERPSGPILLVEEQGEARVLRFVEDLGGLSAQVRLLGHAQREGLALPTSWGQLPGGGAYVTRPYLDGPTLAEAAGTIDGPGLVQVTANLLDALASLHDCGLLHRDIKPENVILMDGRAHLIDLDLAGTSGSHEVAGTKGYLSPGTLNRRAGHSRGGPVQPGSNPDPRGGLTPRPPCRGRLSAPVLLGSCASGSKPTAR